MTELKPGQTFLVDYPFVRETYTQFDEGGGCEVESWSPGVRYEDVPPDSCEMVCDGWGKMRLEVVSVHKPGAYPARAFFTRKWCDPDGHVFGKGKLHIKSVTRFRQLAERFGAGLFDERPRLTKDEPKTLSRAAE